MYISLEFLFCYNKTYSFLLLLRIDGIPSILKSNSFKTKRAFLTVLLILKAGYSKRKVTTLNVFLLKPL